MVLGDVSRLMAAEAPERTAIVDGQRSVTYGEWEREANALAALLLERGVRPGERVAMLLSNGAGFFVAYHGVAKAGAVAVPIGTRLGLSEMRFLVDHSRSRVLIHDSSTAAMASELAEPTTASSELTTAPPGPAAASSEPGQCELLDLDHPDLAARLRAGTDADDLDLPQVSSDDDAAIFYTSGTTASPKGARLSHRAVLNCARIVGDRFEIGPEDVTLAMLPLYHTATHFVPLPTLVRGGTVVIHEGFKVEEAFDLLIDHRITHFPTVTAVAVLMAKFVSQSGRALDLSRLRKVYIGGAGVPPTLLDSWAAFAPETAIVNCYGLTENSPAVASLDPSLMEAKTGSVGLPYDGIEVRIVSEDGGEVQVDEIGEILVRGDSTMSGYLDNPEASAATLRDGWLYTGDLGTRDAEGYMWIVGRKKHMLKRGGENVFPDEVEAALIKHAAVREAIVVGVPDEVMGERVGAIVAAQPGTDPDPAEVVASCRELLADFKLPEFVEIRAGELPKNSVGKVDARHLHEDAREGRVTWTDLRRGRARAS
jgi:long-chain acyl-CoA synthetase